VLAARHLHQTYNLKKDHPITLAALQWNQNLHITGFPWFLSQAKNDPYPYPTTAKITGIQADTAEEARAKVMQTISTYTGPDVDVQLPLSKVIYEKKGHHQGTYTAKPIIPQEPIQPPC
jgi:hypothetical protein